MPSTFSLIFALLCTLSNLANAAGWEPVTTKKRPDCTAESPCRVMESNAVFEVIMNSQMREGMKVMHEIEIKNLKNGSIEKYKVDEMNNIGEKEFFELSKIQLKEYAGLALYAYNSAREGKAFYYFLYDAAKQKFVQSESTFPKLSYDPKVKAFVTPVEGSKYVVDKNLKLISR
ncbi:MAG TPA: hypothetical protein VN132_13650 [Bdellovibrio sp.]|nr:hypothetical protein [Bdellovibrio sp.]